MLFCLIKVVLIGVFLNAVVSLPVLGKIKVFESNDTTSLHSKLSEEPNFRESESQENVAETPVFEEVKATSEHKHTPPPECHGERKEVDPAAAEEYKAKKHTKPMKVKKTTLGTTKVLKKIPTTSTGTTKKSTKRHGVKYDQNGDSIWEDDSNDSPDSPDSAQKKQAKIDSDGNMIDAENQNSGERVEESEEESEESDGIPIITIPLVDILNKYALDFIL